VCHLNESFLAAIRNGGVDELLTTLKSILNVESLPEDIESKIRG
jgi:hypothetical protein